MDFNDIDVFHELDYQGKGFVSHEQICEFYSALVESPINEELVKLVIAKVCGDGAVHVPKHHFLSVLEELDRRCTIDSEAYWDFQALDCCGSNSIDLSHALLLFREYHGDQFSLQNWRRFLESREKPESDVYFDELRLWLSAPPGDDRPSTQSEIVEEELRIERSQAEAAYTQLKDTEMMVDTKDLRGEDKEKRQEKVEDGAKKKLQKWLTYGFAAMLKDLNSADSDLRDEGFTSPGKDSIKTADVLTLLERKYSLLQDRILWELSGRVASIENEKSEIFNKLKKMVSKPSSKRFQDEEFGHLVEKSSFPFTLLSMLGDLPDGDSKRRQEFEGLRVELQTQGKSEMEIDSQVRMAYSEILKNEQTCSEMLAQLTTRLKGERDEIMSCLHGGQTPGLDSLSSTQALNLNYCRLLRQIHLLQGEGHLRSTCLAVGLAERLQTYKAHRYDWDRDRSQALAKERLEARLGQSQVKRSTTNIDLDIEKGGSAELKTRLVKELEQTHYLEREAMIHFLQSNETKSYRDAAATLSSEARQRKIQNLRRQRPACIALGKWEANQSLLAEATALYLYDQSVIGEKASASGGAAVSSMVLADLQQRQEIQANQILAECVKQDKPGVTRAVLAQIETRQDELFPNIAFVVLGEVEVSGEDQQFVSALEVKFKAMRDQVFVFGLIEKMGSGCWRSMSTEEKQEEISKLRKKEKMFRVEGRLKDMAEIIGPRSQALPGLSQLIGLEKIFPDVPANTQFTRGESLNLLADLATRLDGEQENLLSWLQLPQVQTSTSRVKYVQLTRLAAEKFVANTETNYETCLLATGLLERITQTRLKDDQDKQLTLAERRFAIRKNTTLNGEKLRSPPKEKLTPKGDNLRDLQAVMARAMLRRHYHERETILSLLQDPGLDELVEAAAVMSPDQALLRVKELKIRREKLNLDDKEDNEEQTFIFEEAAAIRLAEKVKTLNQSQGGVVPLEKASVHLLCELQDLQDAELARLFSELQDMSASDLSSKTEEEVKALENNYNHNVMKVFTKLEGDDNQKFGKLVEQKYRRLLSLLVEESLYQQHGGKHTWDKQGQKQKVKAVSALLAKATELWDAGDSTSLSSWIHAKFHLKPSLPYLAGTDRKTYIQELAESGPAKPIGESESIKAASSAGPGTVDSLYARSQAETSYIQLYLNGLLDKVPSDEDKQLLYNKLAWEVTLLESTQNFTSAALIVGLAERQAVNMKGRLEHDNARYQILAEHVSSGEPSLPVAEVKKIDRLENVTELQSLLLKCLQHKHVDEWKVMLTLLSRDDVRSLRETLSVETSLQRDNRITGLLRQRENLDLKELSKQHRILAEALTVRRESVRQTLSQLASKGDKSAPVTDEDVDVQLISQLIQFQLVEAQIYLEAFVVEDAEDLRENHATIRTEISQGHVTNIASVAFTGLALAATSEDENQTGEAELVDAVNGKYDALRDQLLIQALIDQMGEAEWNRLSDLERQRLLLQLKLKEKRLRREGKYDEAAALLGELRGNEDNIRKLLDEARALHDEKLQERLERRRARLAQGLSEEECNELEAEENGNEEEEETEGGKNILLYLDQCSEQEREELLKRLHGFGDEHERERQRHLELVRLRREERRLREEDSADAAMRLMGLAQNQHDKSMLSKEEERRRQQELARQRLDMARRLQHDNLVRGESVVGKFDSVDGETSPADGRMDDVVLGLLDIRHTRERNMLLKLLEGHSNEEAQSEARNLSNDDINTKLQGLWELFNLWRDSESQTPADGQTILQDSVVLSIECKRRELEVEGQLLSNEDLKVELLAQLQEVQEAEASQAMLMLIDVDGDQAEMIMQIEQQKLSRPEHDNLAHVLLEQHQGEGEGEDTELIQNDMQDEEKTLVTALEKKYDGMKDKLLMEALMREMGDAEWSRLSDLERQKKLVELKMRERRLRREGKLDELAQLLGNFAEDSDRISQLLGETEEDQKQKVMEKLALRKRLREEREMQGEAIEEEELDKLVEEEDRKIQAINILNQLDKQFEGEKEALLAALKNQPDIAAREKKRQHELARIKREERMLKKEEKFDSAAMIFARGEQNMKCQAESFMSEKERQQDMARRRLEELKKKKAAKLRGSADDELKSKKEADELMSPDMNDESGKLASCVLSQVEQLQTAERSKLSDLISSVDLSKTAQESASLSNTDLQQKHDELQKEHEAWEAKTSKLVRTHVKLARLANYDKSKFDKEMNKIREEQATILQRALSIKLEMERRRLSNLQPNATHDQIKEELCVCAMLALQEKQQQNLANTQAGMDKQTVEELKESLEQQKLTCQLGLFVSLPATCFNVLMASELNDLLKKKSGVTFEDENVEMLLADEFQSEKEELLRRGEKEGINVDAALKKLGDQYELRKQALQTDLARQHADLRERVAMKRKMADDLAWDRAATAGKIFATGSANHDSVRQAKTAELKRQDTLLQQRLQERRAAKEAEKTRVAKESQAETDKSESSDHVTPLSSSRRVSSLSLTREKTVVDVSEDQKQAMYDQLLQQERFKHDQITAAQARQEQMLKQRLEDRSTRRDNEVAALFSLGERQKTTLQEFKKGERERQLAQMQDRMARMRESRSQSPPKRMK